MTALQFSESFKTPNFFFFFFSQVTAQKKKRGNSSSQPHSWATPNSSIHSSMLLTQTHPRDDKNVDPTWHTLTLNTAPHKRGVVRIPHKFSITNIYEWAFYRILPPPPVLNTNEDVFSAGELESMRVRPLYLLKAATVNEYEITVRLQSYQFVCKWNPSPPTPISRLVKERIVRDMFEVYVVQLGTEAHY